MNEAVSDVIVSRQRHPDGMSRMLGWSIGLHAAAIMFAVFMPESWRRQDVDIARTVMTISLGGAPGPRTGGMTQIGGRTVQTTAPEQPVRRAETPTAAKPPEMVLPDRPTRPRPRPERAPADAIGQTPTSAPEPEQGSARAVTGARGQGFGLSSGGGGGAGVQLDVGDFCCPEYLEQLVAIIQRNWASKQGVAGATIMRFTVQRNGTIEAIQVARPSGFVALDLAAQRALYQTRLPQLPAQYPNASLTMNVTFEYSR